MLAGWKVLIFDNGFCITLAPKDVGFAALEIPPNADGSGDIEPDAGGGGMENAEWLDCLG